MKRALAVGLLVLLAAACAGPSSPIEATMREFPQRVRLKAASVEEVPIAPLPPSAPQLTGGLGPLTSPPTVLPAPSATPSTARPAPPAEACPKAGLGETALFAAGPAVKAPATPATYAYRTSGKHVVGGAQASTVDYPVASTREVGKPTPEPAPPGAIAAFTYDVLVTLGANRTRTTYRVVPQSDVPAAGAPGLYITAMSTLDGAGRETSRFRPAPPMLLLPFPADQGATFTVASTDAASGTTMTYSGAVGDHVRVDACGKVVDTRSVTLTGQVAGRACGPSDCGSTSGSRSASTADFVATYAIATQYGGLSMQDQITVKGGGVGAPFTDELRGTISSVPSGGTA